MKNKGFTFIEIIVATTLLVMLTSMAATTAYNFIQAVTSLKAQYQNLKYNIAGLYTVLAQAKMNYETDLAFQLGSPATKAAAQSQIRTWNTDANTNQTPLLINILLSKSYLPNSRTIQETVYNNGNPVQNTVTVPITDLDSLLRAYLLTDNGMTTGNIVATVTLGTMLDVAGTPPTRPTLPIIDWRSGTLQEIVFPSNLATP